MYLVDMFKGAWEYSSKLFSDQLFYIGGVILGAIFYLTGLDASELGSVLIIMFLDIFTRCWAEVRNKRRIYSRKMFKGFAGKMLSFLIMFILLEHSFFLKEILVYPIIGGFVITELRSVYENLIDAGNKHLSIIGQRLEEKISEFGKKKDNNKTEQN